MIEYQGIKGSNTENQTVTQKIRDQMRDFIEKKKRIPENHKDNKKIS